jgi:hypothetical protein
LLFCVGFSGAAGVCQFLASGSLKNLRGKAKVITGIVFGFVLGMLCAIGVIGLGVAMTELRAEAIMFLLLLVGMATAVVNFGAAIRGILVLRNARVRKEFGRPANPRQGPRPVFSNGLVIGLSCGLAGWFFLVFALALATLR